MNATSPLNDKVLLVSSMVKRIDKGINELTIIDGDTFETITIRNIREKTEKELKTLLKDFLNKYCRLIGNNKLVTIGTIEGEEEDF